MIKIFNIQTASPSEIEEYVINEIRKRVDRAFLGSPISSGSAVGIGVTIRGILKEMESSGVIHRPLSEEDVRGIIEIMGLEWNCSNSTPDVRAICSKLSDAALQVMIAPYKQFEECQNVARFFFLERLRREGVIEDWGWTWTDSERRHGTIFLKPIHPIKFIQVELSNVPDDTPDHDDAVDPEIWPAMMKLLSLLPLDENPDDDDEEPFF